MHNLHYNNKDIKKICYSKLINRNQSEKNIVPRPKTIYLKKINRNYVTIVGVS